MNKKVNLLLLVFLGVFNIIVFSTTTEFTTAFWVSYFFIHFSYLMLIISCLTLVKVNSRVVFGYPLIYLSYIYFIVTLIIGSIFMTLKNLSFNSAFVPQIIITGFYIFAYISNLIANEVSISDEEARNGNVLYIKSISSELNMLVSQVSDTLLKKKIENLYDAVRSSQAKSHASVTGVENKIVIKVEELKCQINNKNFTKANIIINDINYLLSERNNRIKLIR